MRRSLTVLTTAGLLLALLAVPASGNGLGDVDIDGVSEEECEIAGVGEFEEGNIRVTSNANWIIGTCHVRLGASQVAALGGPVDRAKVYEGFDCSVGIEDDGPLDDVDATQSQAVLTPSSWLQIVCRAPFPED